MGTASQPRDITTQLPAAVAAALPAPTRLMSEGAARELLLQEHAITIAMARRLADAGLFGHPFEGKFGRAFDEQLIHDLAAAPEHGPDFLATVPSLARFPSVLILRMGQLTPVDEPDRDFIGFHAALPAAKEPAVREAAEDAIRRWWPLSPARRQHIEAVTAARGVVPVVVSVAKRVVAGREITGIDRMEAGRFAFHMRRAHWEKEVVGTWLNSGRGSSTIWWDR